MSNFLVVSKFSKTIKCYLKVRYISGSFYSLVYCKRKPDRKRVLRHAFTNILEHCQIEV